jgi:hypothetical protein
MRDGRRRLSIVTVAALLTGGAVTRAQNPAPVTPIEYRVLATNKTSTMEKELNEVGDAGFRFQAVMGGETAFGGSEVVAIASRPAGTARHYRYRLLATNKTSTMQAEIQKAAETGFEFRGQTVFASTFGGKEVVCILERDEARPASAASEYQLVATSKTSTLQKELQALGDQGFDALGLTVAQTAFGGSELVVITRRPK